MAKREVWCVEIQLVERPRMPWIVLSQMDHAERDWIPETYHTRKEARERAEGTDHPSRVVRYVPAKPKRKGAK